ncbi:hypothetical protein ACG7TL_009221 [Trametes sanguinea]
MPTKNLAPALRDMGKEFGDLTHLNLLGQPMIILNSYEAAVGILESRSANTSDRPRSVMAELTGVIWEFALLGYTQEWRQRRRVFHGAFQPSVIPKYRPVHLRECRRFLQRLLDTPNDFIALARHVFSATIMDVVYGIDVQERNDPYINLAETVGEIFTQVVVPGKWLVELLPILEYLPSWFPGAGFKRDAARWRPQVVPFRHVPYNATLDAMARGVARPCMVTSLIEDAMQKSGFVSPEDHDCYKDAAGLAWITGADTTLYSVRAMILAMVQHPEVQRKAQQELDAVVGSDRLPDFSDRDALPYVSAVLKETMRWLSVVPLGVPHRVMKEDEWNGYRIPAGCTIIPNQWAMSRDPSAYVDPDRFIPERFLPIQHGGSPARDPEKYQFGFGRRICAGRHFAHDSLFIITASLLHVFKIEPPLSDDGKLPPVAPEVNMNSFLSFHEPFECRITPRSGNAEALIRSFSRMEVE